MPAFLSFLNQSVLSLQKRSEKSTQTKETSGRVLDVVG